LATPGFTWIRRPGWASPTWRQRDVDSVGLYHFSDDMGSEDYNNPLTRMAFRRSQNDPVMRERLLDMMDRRIRPLDVFPPSKMLRFLVAETFSGNLGPWAHLGRSLGTARRVARQQVWFDRALARAERGKLDFEIPTFV
jgi:hypothetical protein